VMIFFFSSRRRHTRWPRDWSSDVCSSDLLTEDDVRAAAAREAPARERREPLRGVRRLIAENTARAHREIPAVTWLEECDFTGVRSEERRVGKECRCRGAACS